MYKIKEISEKFLKEESQMEKVDKMHIDLKESLETLESLHNRAKVRMIRGVQRYGTEMIKKPFEELEEELADAFNYITMAYIKTLKACGGYRDTWSLDNLPDVQGSRLDTKTSETKKGV